MTILKKLDIYWSKARPSSKHEINVNDAIIISKLIYGLESTAMSSTIKHSLDIFQMKGSCKILGVKTTFIDRSKDTQTILKTAQTHIHEETASGQPEKQIKLYSKVNEERQIGLLNKIILAEDDRSIKYVTFKEGTLQPKKIQETPGVKRRPGQPRVKWTEATLEKLWTLIGNQLNPALKYSIMNLQNDEHIQAILEAARQNLCEETPSKILGT